MRCRCCNQEFEIAPLVTYRNMPKSAQYFPDKDILCDEKGVDLCVMQCPFCGMVQLNGEPVPYFRDVIRATAVSQEMRNFREQQFSDWVKRYHLVGKKVLEVGCGCGEYMEIMCTTGAKVYGIEHSEISVKKAQALGYEVYQLFLENDKMQIINAPYDAFYMITFLEHIPTPCTFLRSIAKNLSDDAVGLIEVPNFDASVQYNLYADFIQDHLLYFSADSFCRMLEMNGFSVIKCNPLWKNYLLSAEVRKRRPVDVNGFEEKMSIRKKNVNRWIDEMRKRHYKVAVWGAGHQALADLSLLNISEKIVCVLDSAKFKQNKYTPATHIPVFSPCELNERNIGAVLIMAEGYSEEISLIVREKYPWVRCAVLNDNDVIEISTDNGYAIG